MYTLHYFPGNASLAPHILLEELGVPYRLERVERDKGALDSPAYRTLNPTGLIPTLVEDGQPVFETAAILLHLADRHPEAGLLPAPGTPARALAYQWMIHLTNTIQPAYITYYYPERYAPAPEQAPAVKVLAERRLHGMFDLIERTLEGRTWMLGDRYSAVDPLLFMLIRWGRGFATRPPRGLPNLGAYAARMAARPAVQRTFAQEELAEPWY